MVVDLHMSDFEIDNVDCGYYSMMNWSMIDSEDSLEMVAISNSMTGAVFEGNSLKLMLKVINSQLIQFKSFVVQN